MKHHGKVLTESGVCSFGEVVGFSFSQQLCFFTLVVPWNIRIGDTSSFTIVNMYTMNVGIYGLIQSR